MPLLGSVLASLQWPWEVDTAALFVGEKSEVQRCSLSCGQLPGAWWSPDTCAHEEGPARLGSGPHGEVLGVAALLYSKGASSVRLRSFVGSGCSCTRLSPSHLKLFLRCVG